MENRNNKLNINDKVEYLTMICTIIDYREYSDGKREYKLDLGIGNNPEWVNEDEVSKYSDLIPDHLKIWLSNVIKPFRERVNKIWYSEYNECLCIDMTPMSHSFQVPIFNESDVKKLKPLNTYSLEDLGI